MKEGKMALSLQCCDEKRRFLRVPFDRPARAERVPRSFAHNVVDLLSTDLSEGGVCLSSPELFPLESLVVLDLDTPFPLRTVGRVAWSKQVAYDDRWYMGVEFLEQSEEACLRLRNIVWQEQVAQIG
jgi:hypothetical protein